MEPFVEEVEASELASDIYKVKKCRTPPGEAIERNHTSSPVQQICQSLKTPSARLQLSISNLSQLKSVVQDLKQMYNRSLFAKARGFKAYHP